MEYIVRVKYQNTTKFVVLSENELEWQKFVDRGLALFGTKISERSTVYLRDNIGTDIPSKMFMQIIKNFCRGSNFYVEIKHKSNQNNNDELVTPEQIETYFKSKNKQHFLDSEHAAKQLDDALPLNVNERQELIRILADFIVEKFGFKPSAYQKSSVAKATVIIFPRLKYKNSTTGGTDLLIKGDNGWLNKRIKYLREVKNKLDKSAMNQLNVSQSNQDSAIEPNIENESTAKEDVVFLKSLIVTEENMAIFAEKLNFTREYRLKLLLDKEIHLKEWFPYFFTHPQLILMEFSQANPTVNASVFVNEWPSISQQLRGILANHYKQKTFKTDWSAEIEDVLVVLKLFPTNQVGRNVIASIPNFNKSMNQFIHFEPLNAAPLPGKKGFPHIVACGTSMNDIKYYFIQIENLVFPVPETFTFTQTFDLYFKLHKIFNQTFEPALVNMMTFIQHAIFKMPENGVKPTNRMDEVANMLTEN